MIQLIDPLRCHSRSTQPGSASDASLPRNSAQSASDKCLHRLRAQTNSQAKPGRKANRLDSRGTWSGRTPAQTHCREATRSAQLSSFQNSNLARTQDDWTRTQSVLRALRQPQRSLTAAAQSSRSHQRQAPAENEQEISTLRAIEISRESKRRNIAKWKRANYFT